MRIKRMKNLTINHNPNRIGWYTTITLAVYGNLTQVGSEIVVSANPPQNVQRPSITHEVSSSSNSNVQQNSEWDQEVSNPIPTYTGNLSASNPEIYGSNNYQPDNYDSQIYRNDYYDSEQPKDPRTYHHMDDNDWEKDRRDMSCERDRRSPRPADDRERDRERREGRSRRRSLDRGRSSDSSRHRDRSREIDRLRSRSRSRDRDYVKSEYRGGSRSRSRSGDRNRPRGLSVDRDWDNTSYKKDEYRRRRSDSYDRSRAGSYDKRSVSYERRGSPYDKRAPSYERKAYEKRGSSYERRISPYEKRGSSYERRPPSYERQIAYDEKRHSPYGRIRTSSYGSRSPSRDDPRRRPRTPPVESSRRPLSPRDGDPGSPINSVRSEDGIVEYDRNGKPIPRVDFYHQSYRHKSSIRSPSQEVMPSAHVYTESQHSSLVNVQIVDTTSSQKQTAIESPKQEREDDKAIDAEPFEPILSDEEICDDLEEPSYMDIDYDDYGVEDIIQYYNPFKTEWKKYENVNKIYVIAHERDENTKDVLNATFEELLNALPDLAKLNEIRKSIEKKEFKLSVTTFEEIDNNLREQWVLHCDELVVLMANLCKTSDIILRIFNILEKDNNTADPFTSISNLLLKFCEIGLSFECALTQLQPTFKIRHMKCGIKLAEVLVSHKHNGFVMERLLSSGFQIPILLLELYLKEHMSLSIRLMILRAINGCLSSKIAIEHFMKESTFPMFGSLDSADRPKNVYQVLISIIQTNPLVRIKFSVGALIKKLNLYELLEKLAKLVMDFNKSTTEKDHAEDVELSNSDINFIVNSFKEILDMYKSQSFHISQPKRFLPVTSQFEINKDCSNEPILEFFKIHNFLVVCAYLLTCPTTCNNLVLVSPIYDLLYEFLHSDCGIKFLYSETNVTELLFRALMHPYGQNNSEEFIYPQDLSNYTDLQILGLELAYRLKTFYYLEAISDLQAGTCNENELIDLLKSLFWLTFGNIGKVAVADVIAMGDNADCLLEVVEDVTTKSKNDSPSRQKSPAIGYAIDLIVSAIKFSGSVSFLKRYGSRLLSIAKDHDKFESSISSTLQEVLPYLKPLENVGLLSGENLVQCVEIIKNYLEAAAALPGEVLTCLRVLCYHCVADFDVEASPTSTSNYVEKYIELKHQYHLLQMYSQDGPTQLVSLLDRLCTHFEQPAVHAPLLASTRGLLMAHMLLPALRLLDEIVARLVRTLGPDYRDRTAIPVLLRVFGLARAYPPAALGYRVATRAAHAAIRALLAYAQPSADEAADGDSIRRGPWTGLCTEVLAYTTTAPYTFMPGLLVLSELLPLPLPMQSREKLTPQELADTANERRLWSAHLHALSSELVEVIQMICTSAYRPVMHVLRRVCVQLADLAPNTASTVARAALGALAREIRPGEPASACVARVLAFIACLLSHAPIKCAVLYAMATSAPRVHDLQNALCTVLSLSHPSQEHTAAQECAAHALSALCDAEVTLAPTGASPDTLLGNSLPGREPLAALLAATADCLEAPNKSCAVMSVVLRTYFVLTEHEYGFQQFRRLLAKRKESFGKLFVWAMEGLSASEERAEVLSLYVALARVLRAEEGEGPLRRRSVLAVAELADMVGYSPPDLEHPALALERMLKEKNADEDAIANAAFLAVTLGKLQEGVIEPAPTPSEGPVPPPPETLVTQWGARAIHTAATGGNTGPGVSGTGEADARLSSAYWLTVPPQDDDPQDTDLVSCDIAEVANTELSGIGGAGALTVALRTLLGSPRTETAPDNSSDLRPPVSASRARVEGPGAAVGVGVALGLGGDTFRSRPPNTSRPPSLHVDDFTALEGRHAPAHYGKPQPTRGMRRGIAVADRGRFASATPQTHYRYLKMLLQTITSSRVSGVLKLPKDALSATSSDAQSCSEWRGRGAWELAAQHFGHYSPTQYMMSGMAWGGGRAARGPRSRTFMR
ncbi:Protein virilizer [Eumeta japonica]|uniref:Protein virilizer n=1 Tax=Eumeta variegata TaxID=151549 RepID=A0A4C1T540_EUMVA|nr:Protein virilizer [Eumeta japonica]